MNDEIMAGTGINASRTINPALQKWHGEFDVLVVGLGAAGASATIEAASRGAKVAIIDRFRGGGSTALSGSVYYAGGGTALQKKLEVKDDVENMYRYLKYEVGTVVSDETLQRFCQQSVENFAWVQQQGVRYSGDVFTIKTTHPRPEYSLYYSGNELLTSTLEKTQTYSSPRGHVADGNAKATGLGSGFFKALGQSACRAAKHFYRQSRVSSLLQDDQGRVVGVEIQQLRGWTPSGLLHRIANKLANTLHMASPKLSAKCRLWIARFERRAVTRYIKASTGVILSSGGFIFNRDMVREHLPTFMPARMLGQAGDNGAGIALGVSAGGMIKEMHSASAWRFINPPKTWPRGMVVNLSGHRYCDEASYGAVIGTRMYRDNLAQGMLIIDSDLYDNSTEFLSRDARSLISMVVQQQLKTAYRADSIQQLAEITGIHSETLLTTLEQYNACARGEQLDPFEKSASDMSVIVKPPFYAIDLAAGGSPALSLGGLVVDELTGQVKSSAGKGIAGLYAAGRTAVGVASNNYVSGLSIADGVFSGRRAGASASKP
tara:strand:+ start:1518 stop:3158 length:1641 start_codon:yes stop_codon:yes gene_type:complete